MWVAVNGGFVAFYCDVLERGEMDLFCHILCFVAEDDNFNTFVGVLLKKRDDFVIFRKVPAAVDGANCLKSSISVFCCKRIRKGTGDCRRAFSKGKILQQ